MGAFIYNKVNVFGVLTFFFKASKYSSALAKYTVADERKIVIPGTSFT